MSSNEHEFQIMRILGNISADVAATREAIVGLAGPNGRVTVLEDAARSANRQRWIHSSVILPFITIAHLVAKRFGV
jgi:hypothetical protein